eukprot:jgi/Mesvir1/7220/Mv19038-RA.1
MELGRMLTDKPRILVVSRRHKRKDKYVNFVGEYHLELILKNGAVPVVVPRLPLTQDIIDAYEPMHGLLVVEGEDIDKDFASKKGLRVYDPDDEATVQELLEKVKLLHASDTSTDTSKDALEIELITRTLKRGIPYLGLCRGSQLLNVCMGGSLYYDVELELPMHMKHIDYNDYDGFRHPIRILPGTPLESWYGPQEAMPVNSYHHQGSKRLANSLKPMAYSPDGLIEAFYDPTQKFRVGLQFHPERMLDENPGGYVIYEKFVNACISYHRKQMQRHLQCLARYHASPVFRMTPETKKKVAEVGGTMRGGNGIFADMAQAIAKEEEDTERTVEREVSDDKEEMMRQRRSVDISSLSRRRDEEAASDELDLAAERSAMSVEAMQETIARRKLSAPTGSSRKDVLRLIGRPASAGGDLVKGKHHKVMFRDRSFESLSVEGERRYAHPNKRYADSIGISVRGGSAYARYLATHQEGDEAKEIERDRRSAKGKGEGQKKDKGSGDG